MVWVFGVLVLLFFGLELWALAASSKAREAAWKESQEKDEAVG